jgi:hypothetical protein
VLIYGWFTQGFGTTDLQEAKALLVELSYLCTNAGDCHERAHSARTISFAITHR